MNPILSAISIAGEDDSLVSASPELGDFACSPLKVLGSRTPRVPPRPPKSGINGIDAPKSSPLSRCNKENLNSINIKSGAPNLSVEPQTMKKRKKGGGYSLRKSLAWNKAFFTEEGVLDPSELSMVSGISSNLDMEELSSICEEETELMQNNSSGIGSLGGLKSLEEDLFKELPCNHLSEQETATLPQKQGPQGCHARRIIPAQTVKECVSAGKGSSSGSASISQKRLLTANTTKVVARNSKIPKIPAVKQDKCGSQVAARSTGTPKENHVKSSTIPKSGASIPTSINLKGDSKARSSPNAATSARGCRSKPIKILPRFSAKSTDNSGRVSSKLSNHPTTALKRIKLSKVTTNKAHQLSEADKTKVMNGTTNVGIPLHPILQGTASSKALHVQAAKPSGLRMPSPSLKFFSETNAPTAKKQPHENIQATKARSGLANSSILIASAVAPSGYSQERKLPQVHGGSSKLADHAMSMNDNVAPQSSEASSGLSKVTSHEKAPRCDSAASVNTKVLCKMNSQHQMQDASDDFGEKFLEGVLVSPKDELAYAANNRLVSSDSESMTDHHKPLNEFLEFQHHEGLVRENSNECREMRHAAESLGVEVPLKEHFVDAQNKLSYRFNGLRPDSQIEDMVAFCGQCTSAAPGPSSSVIRHMHAEDNAPKSDENAYVMRLSSERNMGEGASALCASGPMGYGIAVEESTVDPSNNAADSNTAGQHSHQGEVECLHGYDSLIIHDELTTKEFIATKHLPEPEPEPIEHNKSLQAITELSCEEKQSFGKVQEDGTENINVFPEVTSIGRGTPGALLPVNHMNDRLSFEHMPSTNHSQCLQVAKSLQEHDKQQELQNETLDSTVMFGAGIDSSGNILLNELSPLGITNVGDAYQKTAISSEASEAQVYEAPSSFFGTDPRDGPCSNLATDMQGDNTEFSPKNVLPCSPISGLTINDQCTSSVFHPSVGISCSPTGGDSSGDTAAFDESLDQHMTVNKLGISPVPTEATETTFQCHISNEESANEWQGILCMEERNAQMATKTSRDDAKQGGLVIKVPTNVVPFSDEWLAAIEAAGEEILTSKGGRVQNSPPDRPLPEPSPWSPVKRKTCQALGPYDCTKFTNNQH